MAVGLRAPWCYWRCPNCEVGDGQFSIASYSMRCWACGEDDSQSDSFLLCVDADHANRQREREAEKERAERQRIADAQKVKISPKEWAD